MYKQDCQESLRWGFYMVEYYEILKMAFSKILDFCIGSKLALQLPNDKSNDRESQNFD